MHNPNMEDRAAKKDIAANPLPSEQSQFSQLRPRTLTDWQTVISLKEQFPVGTVFTWKNANPFMQDRVGVIAKYFLKGGFPYVSIETIVPEGRPFGGDFRALHTLKNFESVPNQEQYGAAVSAVLERHKFRSMCAQMAQEMSEERSAVTVPSLDNPQIRKPFFQHVEKCARVLGGIAVLDRCTLKQIITDHFSLSPEVPNRTIAIKPEVYHFADTNKPLLAMTVEDEPLQVVPKEFVCKRLMEINPELARFDKASANTLIEKWVESNLKAGDAQAVFGTGEIVPCFALADVVHALKDKPLIEKAKEPEEETQEPDAPCHPSAYGKALGANGALLEKLSADFRFPRGTPVEGVMLSGNYKRYRPYEERDVASLLSIITLSGVVEFPRVGSSTEASFERALTVDAFRSENNSLELTTAQLHGVIRARGISQVTLGDIKSHSDPEESLTPREFKREGLKAYTIDVPEQGIRRVLTDKSMGVHVQLIERTLTEPLYWASDLQNLLDTQDKKDNE